MGAKDTEGLPQVSLLPLVFYYNIGSSYLRSFRSTEHSDILVDIRTKKLSVFDIWNDNIHNPLWWSLWLNYARIRVWHYMCAVAVFKD